MRRWQYWLLGVGVSLVLIGAILLLGLGGQLEDYMMGISVAVLAMGILLVGTFAGTVLFTTKWD